MNIKFVCRGVGAILFGSLALGAGVVHADDSDLSTRQCAAPKVAPADVDPGKATKTEMVEHMTSVRVYTQALRDYQLCIRAALDRDLEPFLSRVQGNSRKTITDGIKAYLDLEAAADERVLIQTVKSNSALAEFRAARKDCTH